MILSATLALAACGGGGDDVTSANGPGLADQALTYSYPGNHQAEVAPQAPVVLRFTSAVDLTSAKNAITLHEGGIHGTPVDYTARLAPDHNGVILTPADNLKPDSQYTVTVQGLTLADGAAADQNVVFHTKALDRGPQRLQVEGPDINAFTLQRHYPNGSAQQPVMDFSTFRLQFNQPIDPQTARYGDDPATNASVALLDSDGEVVPATMLVQGPYLTVDPKADYLKAGEPYTLELSGDLKSTYGDSLAEGAGRHFTVTPMKSTPQGQPSVLVLKVTESDGGNLLSPLTGMPLNVVPVNGTLLGENVNATQTHADIRAELASVVSYPTYTAFRIPEGTVLNGDSIDVQIGGAVPAGFSSGAVKMVLLSDATGYLEPNDYTDNPNAKRHTHLFMDVGIATADPRANGAFTQNLLHIELVGTAQVSDGKLKINAVGVVQPDILGEETGYGVLSLQLRSYEDQSRAPGQVVDTTAPTLQSWTMGMDQNLDIDKSLLAKPGDPLIFNFDEPLDPASIEGQVTLYHNGTDITDQVDITVDGAAVVIKAAPTTQKNEYGTTVRYPQLFDYNEPGAEQNQYRVQIENGLTDIAGNAITPIDESFTLATRVDEQTVQEAVVGGGFSTEAMWDYRRVPHSPMVLSAYPGFPCALKQAFLDDLGTGKVDASRDLANDKQGVCAGAFPGLNGTKPADHQPMDDVLPVMTIPNDHPIIVSFDSAIDPTTVILGRTFKVEKQTSDNTWQPVAGELDVQPMSITFRPSEPWQQQGVLYRYTLLSAGYTVCEYADPTSRRYGQRRISSIAQDCYQPATTSTYGDARTTIPFVCASASMPANPAKDSICGASGLPLQTNPLGTIQLFGPDPSFLTPLTDYERYQVGVAPQAGGPNFVQFFRAGPATHSVLQRLMTRPVSDTNHNFFNDRDKLSGEVSPAPTYTTGSADFPAGLEEYGPEAGAVLQPGDFGYNPAYDPGGLKLPPNSAKLLSRNQVPELAAKVGSMAYAKGIMTGCNWQQDADGNWLWDQPMVCPERKLSYLTSSLVVEVTDQVTDQGIKIKIWPALIAGTSVDIYAAAFGITPIPGYTGPQYLRMRYEGDHKNKPIIGHITEKNGVTVLEVDDLPLYLDVPFAALWSGVGRISVNMRSYPMTMDLVGQVQFLNDGRMTVEQWNTNPVDILLELSEGNTGYGAFFIPDHGSRLNYVSAPIK